MRILHLADLHLGWRPNFLGSKNEERGRERDNFLTRAVDFALDKKNEISAVLIAGDLFETHRPPAELLEYVLSQLNRLVENNLYLVTVPGNHDEVSYQDSVYKTAQKRWPGVLVLNPNPAEIARLEKDGRQIAFYGLAYSAGLTRTSPPLQEFPKGDAHIHVGIFHGSLNWDAGDRSLPLSGEALSQSGYHCVALGHIHQHSVRYLGQTVACYAGAPEAKHFSDPGCGTLTILNLGESTSVETVDAQCRPCLTCKVDVSELDSPQEVEKLVESQADSRAMQRIVLTGVANFQIDAQVLQEKFAHLFYHLEINGDNVFLDDAVIERLAAEPTIRGYFVRSMQDRLKQSKEEEEREVVRRALLRGVAALGGGAVL
ncbi:metallophosphoesterase family protein [Dethiobacter alkaliphilus]|uniref:Metallophosphoesterase n=1 Tax=Dethiobacter alkaliphilus AHT 1 TaxID=555088 RepID=C0GDI6_DETAL|nr:DNA repair exonuclease [Dethiobacter alkaliphilus]EEG78707.1 metallophosphoesterase [Dethiobacter alkaliphilus AHT 1]